MSELICSELKLFEHQKDTIDAIVDGRNVLLRTGTGSGKTEAVFCGISKSNRLRYEVPVQVIYVYPTKALTNDQENRLTEYYKYYFCRNKNEHVCLFHGDNPHKRKEASKREIILTNPQMLLYVIKYHSLFYTKLCKNLKFVVLDEYHMYNAYQVALTLTMLKTLKEIADEDIQVIILSATMRNMEKMKEDLEKAIGQIEIVSGNEIICNNNLYPKNVSPTKELLNKYCKKNKIRYTTHTIDPRGYKHHNLDSCRTTQMQSIAYLVKPCLEKQNHSFYDMDESYLNDLILEMVNQYINDDGITIFYTNTKVDCDGFYNKVLKKLSKIDVDKVKRHHSGVDKTDRNNIEKALKDKNMPIKIVFSIKTLAQGMDSKYIKRIVHIGLPPKVSDFLQREGRKGRIGSKFNSATESILFLRPKSNPIDNRWMPQSIDAKSLITRHLSASEVEAVPIIQNGIMCRFLELILHIKIKKTIHPDLKIFEDAEFIKTYLHLERYLIDLPPYIRFYFTKQGFDLWNFLSFYGHGKTISIKLVETWKEITKTGFIDAVKNYLKGSRFLFENTVYEVIKWSDTDSCSDIKIYAKEYNDKKYLSGIRFTKTKFNYDKTKFEHIPVFEFFGKLILYPDHIVEFEINENGELEVIDTRDTDKISMPIFTNGIEVLIESGEEIVDKTLHLLSYIIHEKYNFGLDEFNHIIVSNGYRTKVFLFESALSGLFGNIEWKEIFTILQNAYMTEDGICIKVHKENNKGTNIGFHFPLPIYICVERAIIGMDELDEIKEVAEELYGEILQKSNGC